MVVSHEPDRRRPLTKFGDPDLLTPQRRVFVDTLMELGLEPGSVVKAHEVAFPSAKAKYRSTQAFALYREPLIQKALARAKEQLRHRHNVTLDAIITETAKIAFGDVRDIVSWNDDGVRVTPSAQLTGRGAALISEIEVIRTGVNGSATVRTKLKTHSKLKALDQLAKLLGFYELKPETTINITSREPKELAADIAFLVRAAGMGTPWHRPAEILSLEKVAGPLIDRGQPEEELKEDVDEDDQNASGLDAEDSDSPSNSKPAPSGTQSEE